MPPLFPAYAEHFVSRHDAKRREGPGFDNGATPLSPTVSSSYRASSGTKLPGPFAFRAAAGSHQTRLSVDAPERVLLPINADHIQLSNESSHRHAAMSTRLPTQVLVGAGRRNVLRLARRLRFVARTTPRRYAAP